jgi:hypothetical protein
MSLPPQASNGLDIAATHVPTELPAALSVVSSLPPQASNGLDIAATHVPTELPAILSEAVLDTLTLPGETIDLASTTGLSHHDWFFA